MLTDLLERTERTERTVRQGSPAQTAGRPGGDTTSIPAGTPTGTPRVVIEVMYLRAGSAGSWRYRQTTSPLPENTDPEQAARRIAGLDDTADAATNTVLHSTSWRYRATGQIVLTYAVAPDPDPAAPSVPLESLEIARGTRPDQPAPANISPDHVAAHAVRHLALLADTDPVVAAAIGRDARLTHGLTNDLARHAPTPAPAGQLS